MPSVVFTPNLRRHINCPTIAAQGSTVREALEFVFSQFPQGRGYILDDQGMLRKHVVVFIDGNMIVDRAGLSDPVENAGEIYIMQALSGG